MSKVINTIKVIRFKTLEKLIESYWKVPFKEYVRSDGSFVGGNGKSVKGLTTKDEIDCYRHLGFWGYSDKEKNIIYIWIDKKKKPNTLHFFAHEIGHLTGKQFKNLTKEENRAEEFAQVTLKAYKLSLKPYE